MSTSQNVRLTPIRQAIIDLLKNHHLLSADDITATVNRDRKVADRVTVYRTLEYLEKNNIVCAYHFGERQGLYELRDMQHHHHLVCQKCGAVSTTYDCNIGFPEFIGDFKISHHHMDFYGVCKACQDKGIA